MNSFGTMKFVANTPKKIQHTASKIMGNHIINGTSLTSSNSDLRRPRKMPPINLIKLASVSAEPNTANPNQTIHNLLAIPVPLPKSIIPWYIIHFEANPLNGGTPEIDIAKIKVAKKV